MTHMLDDLLVAASIHAGAFDVHPEPSDFSECLDSALGRLDRIPPGSGGRCFGREASHRAMGAPESGAGARQSPGNALKYSPAGQQVQVAAELRDGELADLEDLVRRWLPG